MCKRGLLEYYRPALLLSNCHGGARSSQLQFLPLKLDHFCMCRSWDKSYNNLRAFPFKVWMHKCTNDNWMLILIMFWFWMMMRNPPECPPLKFEGSGSAQDNFLPSMDIHGALYVHCTGPVHCTSVCALSDIFQWKFTAHSSVHWISALFSLHALLLHCRAKVHALIFSRAL